MTLKEYFKVSVPSIGMYRGVTFYYRTAEVDGIKLIIPDSVETEVFVKCKDKRYKLTFHNITQTISKKFEEDDGKIVRVRFIAKRKKYIFTDQDDLDDMIMNNCTDSLLLYGSSQYNEIMYFDVNKEPAITQAVFIWDNEYGYGDFYDDFLWMDKEAYHEFMKRTGLL